MATFLELKKQYQILTNVRDELICIRDIFDEKTKEGQYLKKDIRRGGLSGKYKELELVECTQNIEYIRIAFEKKYKEFIELRNKINTSINPVKILDLRYKDIKQKEFELLEKNDKTDKILQDCEEKELQLERVCAEYEEIKTQTLVLNNRTTHYDYGNTLYKKSSECLKRLKELEKEIIIKRQHYELESIADSNKKEEINKEMAEFFKICEGLEEEVELEEGILL